MVQGLAPFPKYFGSPCEGSTLSLGALLPKYFGSPFIVLTTQKVFPKYFGSPFIVLTTQKVFPKYFGSPFSGLPHPEKAVENFVSNFLDEWRQL